jgi:hypothetical protein
MRPGELSSLSSQLYAPTPRHAPLHGIELHLLCSSTQSHHCGPDFAMGKLEFCWRVRASIISFRYSTISFAPTSPRTSLPSGPRRCPRHAKSAALVLSPLVGHQRRRLDRNMGRRIIRQRYHQPVAFVYFSALSLCSAVTRRPTACCAHVDMNGYSST